MAQDPMGKFEIPAEMRNFAEQSMAQAKKAFDGYVDATQKAFGMFENKAATGQNEAKAMREQMMKFAERNVTASFDCAQKLMGASTLSDMMKIQSDYVKSQMSALNDQAKEIGEKASKAAADMSKNQ